MSGWFKWIYYGILDFFQGLFDWFRQLIVTIWEWFSNLFELFLHSISYIFDSILQLPFVILDFILTCTVSMTSFIVGEDGIYSRFGLENNPELPNQVFNSVSISNSFFPLTEIMVCSGVYLSFCFFWFIYKFIKSWLPTVST